MNFCFFTSENLFRRILTLVVCLALSATVWAQDGSFNKLTFNDLIKSNGPAGYSGWGVTSDNTFDPRPGLPNGGAFVINHHTGLTFSAHSVYGGIRFYNQAYPGNPLDPATGAIMAMNIVNGKVGVGTTSPSVQLDVVGKSVIQNALNTDNYANIGQHNAQFRILNGLGGYKSKALEFALLDNGTGVIQANEMNVGYNSLVLNPVAGNVGIGTTTPKEKLSVNGNIRAKEIKVETANWPDYVFAKDYALPSLKETEQHIQEKGHLPGIPSAQEVKSNGVDLGELNAKLLKKIEEMTLYIIDLEKRVKSIESKK
ncbi:hypothetical protein B0O44_104380 [Pedobacter nutrimenti]|uniref:Endosialidase-like protein n=1 Tax=Pedobacter nutrimenti TaxID=1241337 RepID=A0A318URJ5_9SPHI|nr:hypothetical protein B0O44_104380 [Pedobacter nutrimenti]